MRFLRFKNLEFSFSSKNIEILQLFFLNYDFFETRGKLRNFYFKISHHFVEFNELVLKMYTVLWFEVVFHKIIKENRKNFVSK